MLSQARICTHQLTKLHDQEERDALTALPQTLQDVGMLKAPGTREHRNKIDGQTNRQHITAAMTD